MILKFGDIQAKAEAIELAKNRQRFERHVFIATETLRVLRRLPELDAQIWDYPPIIQRLGIRICRESNLRLRAEDATNQAKNVCA